MSQNIIKIKRGSNIQPGAFSLSVGELGYDTVNHKLYIGVSENGTNTIKLIGRAIIQTSDIADSAITAAKLATDAVENGKIKNGAVNAAKLATDAVENGKIKNGAVSAAKLATDAVETSKIKDSNVTTAKLNDKSVTTEKIDDEAVTSTQLADDSVETAKIASGAVTADKIASGAITKEFTVTIPTTAWEFDSEQDKYVYDYNLSGVTTSSTLIVTPAVESMTPWTEAMIMATVSASDQLSFGASEVPETSVVAQILWFKAASEVPNGSL